MSAETKFGGATAELRKRAFAQSAAALQPGWTLLTTALAGLLVLLTFFPANAQAQIEAGDFSQNRAANAPSANSGDPKLDALRSQVSRVRESLEAIDSPPAASASAAEPASAPPVAPAAATPDVTAELSALRQSLGQHQLSQNIMWTLLTGFLVMFMQAGFAMLEAGMTRAKNVGHTMSMNLMVYALGMLAYWAIGFAIQFGGTAAETSVAPISTLGPVIAQHLHSEWGFHVGGKYFGLFGHHGFFLPPGMLEGGVFALFLFQMVFMDTTATIPTGALAERWRFLPFCLLSLCVGGLIYPIYGNWVWGGGWLAALGKNFGLGHGHVDFAGSSVVHLCGGVIAYVGARVVGPRDGKFSADGKPQPIPGHNLPMGIVGTFVLAFGWFGFNAGSTLSGSDPQIGVIAVNTMLASAAGAVAGMILTWLRFGRPDPSFMCNGMLAGLVAITAGCAFVEAWAAATIGAIAGVVVVYSAEWVETKLRIDDPVGAICVHGVCGAWGVLALGLFADGRYGAGWNSVPGNVRGLFYADGKQLIAQIIGAAACVLAVYVMARICFAVTSVFCPHRASSATQAMGLDGPELGILGYQPDLEAAATLPLDGRS